MDQITWEKSIVLTGTTLGHGQEETDIMITKVSIPIIPQYRISTDKLNQNIQTRAHTKRDILCVYLYTDERVLNTDQSSVQNTLNVIH